MEKTDAASVEAMTDPAVFYDAQGDPELLAQPADQDAEQAAEKRCQ